MKCDAKCCVCGKHTRTLYVDMTVKVRKMYCWEHWQEKTSGQATRTPKSLRGK